MPTLSIHITVNDEPHALPEATSVAGLLEHLQLGGQRIAVELNGNILPRTRYPETLLAEGDVLLVVRAIGGG